MVEAKIKAWAKLKTWNGAELGTQKTIKVEMKVTLLLIKVSAN